MSSDTSLVFDLVARDRATEALGRMREKFHAASAAIGVGVASALGVGVAANLDMEAANDKMAAQLGVGPAEAAELSKVSANVYGQAWGDSTETVNAAITGVYRNIGDTSAAEGGLEGITTKVLALGDTFEADIGGTTAAVGQMIKTGLAKDADEALDILTAGFQKGANKADDLLDTMNEYGTQFRKFGIDGKQATGLLTQGLKGGARDADLVADSIKEFSIRAIDGSKTTAAGFQAIGLNAGDMAAKIGKGGASANEALDLTLDKLRGIDDPVKREAAAVQLFGTQAEDLGQALFSLDPSSAVKALGDVGGAADRMTKTVGDNPAAALESFKRQAVQKLSEVAGVFIGFAMDNQAVFTPIAATLAGIAVVVLVVRGAMMAWTAAQAVWTAATTVATGVQWAYNAAMAANPIVLIVIAVIALVAVIVLLWKKNEAFRNFFIAAWDMIWGAIKFVWNWVQQNWPLLLAVITGPIGMAVYAVVKYWDEISSATSAAWNAVWKWVKSVPSRIYDLWLNWTLPGLIVKHWSTIKDKTISIGRATINWVKGLPGRLVDSVSSLGSRLSSSASRAWGRFKQANVTIALQAVTWTKGLPGRIRAALGKLGTYLYDSGRSLLMGFWNGIKSYGSTLMSNVSGLVGKVKEYFPFSPAKKGPLSGSGYTTYSGQRLVTDFAKGISSRASMATEAMTGVVSGVSGAGTQGVTAGRTTAAPMRRTAQMVRVVVDVTGGDGELKKVLRKWVRVDGGGNAQKFFGGDDVPFPTTPLDVLVELKLGGTWTDVTAKAYARGGITGERGRQDEGAQTDPGKRTIVLDNRTGDFTPDNPVGAYYGLIGRNTPVRISVNAGSTYLATLGTMTASNGASTPDAAALDITGDIDIRFDATLENWTASGSVELCGKGATTGNQRSWLLLTRDGKLHLEWSTAGTTTIQAESTVSLVVPPDKRMAVRVTLDVDNGAAGNTTTFYTAETIAGPWTQLGAAVITASTTSIFNSTAVVRVGDGWGDLGFPCSSGAVNKFELRNGIAGTLVANPDFTAQTAGATSFADSTGKTWTVGTSTTISNRRTRFQGEISSWPSRWDVSGNDIEVTAEAAGPLRRLSQGARALESTLRRRIPTDGAVLAYWPMEDGANSTQAYSPVPGVNPIKASGLSFASDSSLAGSSALPSINTGARFSGTVPAPAATSTEWHTEFIYNLQTGPAAERTVIIYTGTGTVRHWRLMTIANGARIYATDEDGTAITSNIVDLTGLGTFNAWTRWQLQASQSGGNVNYTIGWIPIGGTGGFISGSYAGTVGRISGVAGPPGDGYSSDLNGMRIGHIAVFSTATTTIYNNADLGFAGDTAGGRMQRLATEENIPLTVYGDTSLQQQVGAQLPATFLDLLGEAADADGGILYEERGSNALAYRDRRSLYNQTPALVLDYATEGHVAPDLTPVDDDQAILNDGTVQRTGGSFGRVVQETGPLNIQDPEDDPDGVGVYADSVTLNLYDDDQPEQIAAWRVWKGTQPGTRYPSVNVDLAAAPSLIDAVTTVDIGDRIQITNPPDGQPPDTIDLIVRGYTETIGHPNGWDITFNCTPARAWNVWELGAGDYNQLKSAGSTLAAGVTSTATSFSVASSGLPWKADHRDTPWRLKVGGEEVLAAAVGTILNANPFFLTDTSGWGTTSATLTRDNTYIKKVDWSGKIVSTAGAQPRAESSQVAVTAAASYQAVGWLYAPVALPSTASISINWFDAAHTFLSTSSNTATLVAGTWTFFSLTATAPASTAFASVFFIMSGTPGAGYELYGSCVRLIPSASVATTSPQAMTVIRSRNGVVKAQSSGTVVQLANPAVIPL